MLKRLAILAVLAAGLSPMPGKAVESSAQGADKGKSQSQGDQKPAVPASSLVDKPIQAGASDPHGEAIAGEDKEHSVKLTSLPPITLTDKQKTFWGHVLDWGPWVFNLLLVVVGGLQVWLLKRTWKTIERQTDAAARNTEAFINKERSRLFLSAEISSEFRFTATAVNAGQSPALIFYKYVGCELLKPSEVLPETPRYTDRGEPASDCVWDEWVVPKATARIGFEDAGYISESENPYLFGQVMSGELDVWFYGIAIYQDSVSSDNHTIKFCYKCHPARNGKHFLAEDGPLQYRSEN